MRPLRRTEHDARVEIMPLIDVVFLLLTFFIFSAFIIMTVTFLFFCSNFRNSMRNVVQQIKTCDVLFLQKVGSV